MTDFLAVADFISNVGALGVLIIIAWAFYKGKVVSREISDKRVEDTKEITGLVVGETMRSSIKHATKEGFVEAWYELRSSGQKMFICPFNGEDTKREKE